MRNDRRTFLTSLSVGLGVSGVGISLVGCSRSASNAGTGPTAAPGASGDRDQDKGDDEVTPAEDLMREHGVLRRVMYLYDDAAERLTARDPAHVPLDALAACAGIVRRVIEDYHEKLE